MDVSRDQLTAGILAVVVIALVYVVQQYRKKYSFWSKRGVKGPTPIPIFGNSWQLMFNEVVHFDKKNGAKYGNLYGYYDGESPVLIISDPELIEEIYIKNFSSFSDHVEIVSPDPIDTSNVLALSGDDWKRVRSVLTSGMTSAKLRNMYQLIDTQDMLGYIHQNVGKELPVYQLYSLHVLNIVTRSFFGLDLDFFKNSDHKMVQMVQNAFEFDLWKMFVADHVPLWVQSLLEISVLSGESTSYMKKFVSHAIEERMKSNSLKKTDFLQTLLDAHRDNTKLSETEVTANAVFMIAAAFDTTSMTLSFISYELARNPDKQKLVQDEIDSILGSNGHLSKSLDYEEIPKLVYLDAVINETLRMNSIDLRGFRRVSSPEGAKVPGTDIHLPKGTTISIPYYVLHSNPKLYPEPEKFLPERFLPENKSSIINGSFMSFGTGPRMCPGIRFAMVNIKSALVSILSEYSFVTTDKTLDDVPMGNGRLMLNAKPIILKLVKRSH